MRVDAVDLLLHPVDVVIVGIAVTAIAVGTDARVAAALAGPITAIVWLAVFVFVAELAIKASRPLRAGQAMRWLATPECWVDIVSVLVVPGALLAGASMETAQLFALIWVLRLARHTVGFALLGRVVRNAAEPLVSVAVFFVIVLIAAATLAYLAEGEGQPEQFGSIPRALWWAIVTLSTTGYGDATPVTLAGRMLAGTTMVCGIGVFALWAGIVASGFGEELRRRDFLRTWALVARVPLFRGVGADAIAAVAHCLRRRDVMTGQVVMRRGQPGEAMYFIVDGAVEVRLAATTLPLGAGAFFGEMALMGDGTRTATVVASEPTTLLELDVADFRRLGVERPELMAAIAAEAARRKDSG